MGSNRHVVVIKGKRGRNWFHFYRVLWPLKRVKGDLDLILLATGRHFRVNETRCGNICSLPWLSYSSNLITFTKTEAWREKFAPRKLGENMVHQRGTPCILDLKMLLHPALVLMRPKSLGSLSHSSYWLAKKEMCCGIDSIRGKSGLHFLCKWVYMLSV